MSRERPAKAVVRMGVPLTLLVTLTGIAASCLTFPLTPLP